MSDKLHGWMKKPIEQKIESILTRYYKLQNYAFSKLYSLDFAGNIPCTELEVDSCFSKENATKYQPYSNRKFKILVQEALATGIKFDCFLDIGCGKGKQLIYAAKYFDFPAVVGIDFSRQLVNIAVNNVQQTHYKNISISNADAREWKIPDGNNLIFLFNPFNEVLLNIFLSSNLDHFSKYPSIIAYAHDVHRHAVERFGFDMIYRSHRNRNSLFGYKMQTNLQVERAAQ